MKRPVFLFLLLLYCPVSLAASMDIATRALERGDYATAAAAFRELAKQGNVKAQSHLGYMYYAGEGVPQSYENAVFWYRKAAIQGDPDAQYNLAVAYAFGEGVKKDLHEATTWYRRAAEQDHPVAQYSLGISHAYGEGVKQDGALAARWFLQAAEQDYEPAQVMIASIYHTGDGIPQDHTKAARWYRKAAEKGNTVAQYNLGTLYRAGKGVVKNNEVAKRWFTKAARQGYAAAEKELQGMKQAVTVAPGGTPGAAKTEPKTTVSRSELPSGDLTSEQERIRQSSTQSDEALVTIRKEDLLTLEQEPETEPLATVDEISGVEYQGAPTARPTKLKEEADNK
ncbi:MAG TPA: tetratricopeptide repeat protein, partial [Gammaproteobacteria bacterium]|nr:tetratricopeptide repeat protein [Gammaproteobacteria bacterium]